MAITATRRPAATVRAEQEIGFPQVALIVRQALTAAADGSLNHPGLTRTGLVNFADDLRALADAVDTATTPDVPALALAGRRTEHELAGFTSRLRADHGVFRRDLAHILLRPTMADGTRLERLAEALTDCGTALDQMREPAARIARVHVHAAVEQLTGDRSGSS